MRATRVGDNPRTLFTRRLLHALAALACLFTVCTSAEAQVNAQPGAVVLVARIQDQAGVQWGSAPVTDLLRQQQLLPEDGANYAAHLFVFEHTVHAGMGHVVQGESLLEATSGRAEMLAVNSTGTTGDGAPVWSWLPREPAQSNRWQNPDPRRGRQQVTQSCLVVAEEGEAALLRVRLTAL